MLVMADAREDTNMSEVVQNPTQPAVALQTTSPANPETSAVVSGRPVNNAAGHTADTTLRPMSETPTQPVLPAALESSGSDSEEESEDLDLNEHVDPRNDTANLDKEGLKCHQCNEVFTQRSQYLTHQRMHNMFRPYMCDQEGCSLRFATKSSLKRHLRTHSGEKPYKCYFAGCNKSFVQPSHLTIHVRTHTGEKPYECDHPSCSLRFATRSDLKMHYRTHTGERPYACAEIGCNKRFARLSDLRTHEFVHTGEKPFKCTFKNCGKSFSKSSDLSKHVRTHTGERPYVCTVPNCGKRYAQRSNLVTHLKTHTRSKRGTQRLSPSEVKQYIIHTGKHRTQRNQMLASATGLASLPAAEVAKAFRSSGVEESSNIHRMPVADITNEYVPDGTSARSMHPNDIRRATANLETIKDEMSLTHKTAPLLENSVDQFRQKCLDVRNAVNSASRTADMSNDGGVGVVRSAFKANTRMRTTGKRPRTSMTLKYKDAIDGLLLSFHQYRQHNIHGMGGLGTLQSFVADQKRNRDYVDGNDPRLALGVRNGVQESNLPVPKPVPYQSSPWSSGREAQYWMPGMYDGNPSYGMPMAMTMPLTALNIKSANVWQTTMTQPQ